MPILSFNTEFTGEVGVSPRVVRITCNDTFAQVTAANYLAGLQSLGIAFYPTDYFVISYGNPTGTPAAFYCTITSTAITLSQAALDPSSLAGQTVTATTSSATPGTIRSLTGKITESAATMTSGNIVGLRGEADLASASGGFVYGTQGKVIPTGTLSGSVWAAAVFGQFDVHAATINAGQCAALWGDWGATGATATDLTGCRGIAFTNTTSNVLHAQDYRYGDATYLMELSGASTPSYYVAAGTAAGSAGNSTHCAAQQVLKVVIQGSAAYIPVFTQNT